MDRNARELSYLNIGQVKTNVGLWSDAPVLVAALGETLDNIGFLANQSQETHDLLTAGTDSAARSLRSMSAPHHRGPKRRLPSKHIALLGVFENQDKLINAVDFILDALDERAERIGDVVNDGIRDPI